MMIDLEAKNVLAVETLPEFQKRTADFLHALNATEKGVILSTDFDVELLEEPSGLSRLPIVWPVNQHNMFYVLEAPPNTDIPTHKHSGAVFRYIISGELYLNKMLIKAGMWCVVRKETPYTVHSETGYTALVAYQDICEVTGRIIP
jgi:hypothetical protein